jgi:hypothetical protein
VIFQLHTPNRRVHQFFIPVIALFLASQLPFPAMMQETDVAVFVLDPLQYVGIDNAAALSAALSHYKTLLSLAEQRGSVPVLLINLK